MWVDKTKEEIVELEKNKKAIHLSLWGSVDKAKSYYNNHEDYYTGFYREKPTRALATPFKVYLLL